MVNLEAGGGTIKEVADLRAWVARTGDVFIFLDSRPGQPVELNAAVPCQIVRQSLARCVIPEALQRPAGVKSTIERLRLTLRGRTRARGRTVNLVTTTGCRRRAWVFGIRLAMDLVEPPLVHPLAGRVAPPDELLDEDPEHESMHSAIAVGSNCGCHSTTA